MTAKRLSLTPDPPRIPVFYTLTKIHKPTPVISGCDGPRERISAFVDHLIQPIAQKQASYLKIQQTFLTSSKTINCLKIQSLSQWTSPASTRIYRRRRILLLYAKHTKNFMRENLPFLPVIWEKCWAYKKTRSNSMEKITSNSWNSHGYENSRRFR